MQHLTTSSDCSTESLKKQRDWIQSRLPRTTNQLTTNKRTRRELDPALRKTKKLMILLLWASPICRLISTRLRPIWKLRQSLASTASTQCRCTHAQLRRLNLTKRGIWVKRLKIRMHSPWKKSLPINLQITLCSKEWRCTGKRSLHPKTTPWLTNPALMSSEANNPQRVSILQLKSLLLQARLNLKRLGAAKILIKCNRIQSTQRRCAMLLAKVSFQALECSSTTENQTFEQRSCSVKASWLIRYSRGRLNLLYFICELCFLNI